LGVRVTTYVDRRKKERKLGERERKKGNSWKSHFLHGPSPAPFTYLSPILLLPQMSKPCPTYPSSFRARVVSYYRAHQSSHSFADVAAHFNMPGGRFSVRRWVNEDQLKKEGGEGGRGGRGDRHCCQLGSATT
jgi:hypothetical protein